MKIDVCITSTLPLNPRLRYQPPPRIERSLLEPMITARPIHHIDGLVANAFSADNTGASQYVDIRLARDRGYIIADARGLGFDTQTPGQRDTKARLVRDKNEVLGGDDKQ